MTDSMSHNDRKSAVCAALGCQDWHVQDMFDDKVVHRMPKPGGKDYEDDGKLYQTPYTVGDDGKVSLGQREEVQRRTVYDPVKQFSVDFSVGTPQGDLVPYVGKAFEVGDYPDKGFSITEAEVDAAIIAFTPVPNDLEHHATMFDGKLGELTRLWRDGKDVYAETLIPAWARGVLGDTLKTSLAWARDTKRVIGNALTTHPRVLDAQLQAAFTAANSTAKGDQPMTLKDRVLALFAGGKKPEDILEDELKAAFADDTKDCPKCKGTGKVPAEMSDTPQPPAPDPATVHLSATNAALTERMLTQEAEAWFTTQLRAGKVLPAQHDALTALFCQAAKADNNGAVTFTAAGALQTGAQMKALTDAIAAAPDLTPFFSEAISNVAGDQIVTLSSTGGNQPSDARMKSLRAMAGLKSAN